MVTRHELLTDTFEQRIYKPLQTGEVRKAYVIFVRLAADRTDILTKLPIRKIVSLFGGKELIHFDGSRIPVGLPTEDFFFELLRATSLRTGLQFC